MLYSPVLSAARPYANNNILGIFSAFLYFNEVQALILLWLPHQPSPYKGWYKLINLIRGCDCRRDCGGREEGVRRGVCAGRQGSGCNKPRGVEEKPDHCAWLMSGKEIPPSLLFSPLRLGKAYFPVSLVLSWGPFIFCPLSFQINPGLTCCLQSTFIFRLIFLFFFFCSLLVSEKTTVVMLMSRSII